MQTFIELLKAVAPLAWPVLIGFVLWRLFPTLTAILGSRSFSVKVAGMELSVQAATDQLKNQIDDLQRQVIRLRGDEASDVKKIISVEPERPSPPAHPRILWVDDNPSNNAFQISQFQGAGIEVVQANSTDEAMSILNGEARFDGVISDMGRREGGAYHGQAGLLLLKSMRKAGYKTPFLIYSSSRQAARNKEEVLAAQGDGATASPVELFEWAQKKTLRA